MQIIEIQIDEFGILTDRKFSFAPGINILEGKNESGKSTLLAFIRFMFYGAPSRGVGETVSERTRRLNWRTGRAAGSMTLEAKGGRYRIERALCRSVSGSAEASRESFTESLQIIDLASGTSLPRGTQPGEYFLGVPAAVFESTAYVRQLGSSALDGTSVSEALENLLTSASESSNTSRALTRLDSARKALLHKNGRGGEIYTLQTERAAVASRLSRAKAASSDRIAAQSLLDSLKKSGGEARAKLNSLEQRCDAYDALILLRRFESLHALEKKTKELRAALDALHAAERGGKTGFFPDRTYAATLRSLERRCAAAEADCARSETELARMRFEQPCDEARAGQAAEIRTAGGIDTLVGRYAELAQSAKSMGNVAILLLVLGALCLAGGGTLFLLFMQPLVLLGKIGIGCAALSLPLLAGSIACRSASRHRQEEAVSLCRRYGMKGIEADEAAFSAWLSDCFSEEEQMKGYAEVLAQVEDELAQKQNTLDALRRETLDMLTKWDIAVTDGRLSEALANAIPRAERDADQAEALERDLDKYESVLLNTAAELKGQDESLLRRRISDTDGDSAELNITALRRERDFTAKQLETIEYKRIETEKQLIALEATTEDPLKLAAKLEELDRRIGELTARHDAIRLAAEALTEAAESMRRGVLPRLRSRAGELLSAITSGRYAGVGVGRGMALTIEDADATRPVELLSAGTVDAAYLALRLALLELLFPAERPPLLLDESLTQLDDDRATAALALLAEAGRNHEQTLIFTCHPREAQLTAGHKIEM